MNKDSTQIINGAKFFKNLHPSDIVITGVVKPSQWYNLQKYMDLVLEYFDTSIPTNVEMDDEIKTAHEVFDEIPDTEIPVIDS